MCGSRHGFSKWPLLLKTKAQARVPRAPTGRLAASCSGRTGEPCPSAWGAGSFWAAGLSLAACRWVGASRRARPAVFTWVCLQRYPEGPGADGHRAALGRFLGPSYSLALKRNCVLCQELLQKLQPYLVWKLLCLEGKQRQQADLSSGRDGSPSP